MRFELKRIEIWPVFRLTFFISTTLFILFFLLLGNSLMEMSQMISGGMGGPESMGQIGIFSLIVGAVMNAFFFSSFVTAGAALYNVYSRQFGGYEFDLDGEFELETIEEELPSELIAKGDREPAEESDSNDSNDEEKG